MRENDEDFEHELREGLRLREAPEGFAERVIARAQSRPVREMRRHSLAPRAAMVRWAIAAGLLIAVGVGGYSERRRQERIAGEHARDQVLLALRITGATLQAVHDKVVDGDR